MTETYWPPTSASEATAKLRAMEKARHVATTPSAYSGSCQGPVIERVDEIADFLKSQGISGSLVDLQSVATTAGVFLPGWNTAWGRTGELSEYGPRLAGGRLSLNAGEMLRAWVLAYCPQYIDADKPPHGDATTFWCWW
jgi:hypothetical protein